jgi:uncharacterized membrane protein YeiH
VFAVSGALVASRKEMDIVGFAMLASVTGIGGGTIRDVLLGIEPVFWISQPAYLVTCVAVAVVTFFLAHIPQSRERILHWFNAVGISLFCVTGADMALASGAGPTVSIAMGVATATFGGIIRDLLGGESPIILRQEIYILHQDGLIGRELLTTLKQEMSDKRKSAEARPALDLAVQKSELVRQFPLFAGCLKTAAPGSWTR